MLRFVILSNIPTMIKCLTLLGSMTHHTLFHPLPQSLDTRQYVYCWQETLQELVHQGTLQQPVIRVILAEGSIWSYISYMLLIKKMNHVDRHRQCLV